jgi:hypothetical protein
MRSCEPMCDRRMPIDRKQCRSGASRAPPSAVLLHPPPLGVNSDLVIAPYAVLRLRGGSAGGGPLAAGGLNHGHESGACLSTPHCTTTRHAVLVSSPVSPLFRTGGLGRPAGPRCGSFFWVEMSLRVRFKAAPALAMRWRAHPNRPWSVSRQETRACARVGAFPRI